MSVGCLGQETLGLIYIFFTPKLLTFSLIVVEYDNEKNIKQVCKNSIEKV